MCGIAGIIAKGASDEMHAVRAMTQQMAYRGPDAERVEPITIQNWSGAFGHRRLAIIDLNPEGEQPMRTAEGDLTIVFNGEIYNFVEIRSELTALSHTFKTQSDTEVILRAYKQWGPAAVEKLNGMFAFVIHDASTQTLFMGRDRLGIKPLYYYCAPDLLVFSSEVRGILASGKVPRELDLESVPEYLQFGSVGSPYTLIKNVVSLPPGSTATWANGQLSINEYWRIENFVGTWQENPRTQEDLAETLDRCVSMETVSDVPLGAFLSGGIDSSAIVSLMSDHSSDVNSVSLVFKEAELDEREFSKSIADKFKTKHQAIEIDASSVGPLLPRFAEFQDQPSVDGLNTYLVSKAAREAGLTVALSGLGGDEIFAGYPSFRMAAQWQKFGGLINWMPDRLRSSVARGFHVVTRSSSPKVERFLRDVNSIQDVYNLSHEVLESKLKPSDDPIDAMTALESRKYMLDTLLRQTDIMSMQHSLEVRVPLLNYEVVECALAIPPSKRLSSEMNKPLLVNSLKNRLPDSVVHRKKATFTLPYAYWLKRDFRDMVEDLICSKRTQTRGLTDNQSVRDLWEGFLADRPGCTWSRIWCLCALEMWCRQYIDGF